MTMRSIQQWGLTLAIVTIVVITSLATPPRLINYQGRVTDNLGNPITANGMSVRFIIYKDSVGGSIMWAEVTSKDIVDGLVTHTLGSLVPMHDSLFTRFDALFLEVLVNAQPQVPRTRLTASPRVASLHGSAGGTVTSDVLVQSVSTGNGLEVSQTGLGRAGRFSIDNVSNSSEALVSVTQGSGAAGAFLSEGSGPAVQATANATGYSVYAQFGQGILSSIGGDAASSSAIKGLITSASPGSFAAAVRGQNLGIGPTGIGVWGSQSGSGWGVFGECDGGTGLRGSSDNGTAIYGTTVNGIAGTFTGGRVTISDASDASAGGAGSGYLTLGSTASSNIVFDDNEIMARNSGSVATLNLQSEGGTVAIGYSGGTSPTGYALTTDGKVLIDGGTDASVSSLTSGYLIVGQTSGLNIVADNNEIMARANGIDTTLYLQSEGGAVAIGAQGLNMPAGYILVVDGKAIMEEVEVQLSNNWPDYVFEEDYKLQSLSELEEAVKETKHLPGIPTASEIQSSGLALGEMQARLLEKIEELTLYVIQINKELSKVQSEKVALEKRISVLESEID